MVAERRPDFARDFPHSEELDALVDAFARGDYGRVRAEAPRLERATHDDAVRRAARTLVERTEADPLILALVALAALLLLVVGGWWIVHAKAGPTRSPPPGVPPVERVR